MIFTSRLSVPDLDEYRRLGGLALSARTVVIQRRAPGATTWTTVATMAVAGTGTYSHTAVSQQATMDWRTVFQPGNDDGVRPATSPVVRVWVSACKTQCPVSVGTGADR